MQRRIEHAAGRGGVATDGQAGERAALPADVELHLLQRAFLPHATEQIAQGDDQVMQSGTVRRRDGIRRGGGAGRLHGGGHQAADVAQGGAEPVEGDVLHPPTAAHFGGIDGDRPEPGGVIDGHRQVLPLPLGR